MDKIATFFWLTLLLCSINLKFSVQLNQTFSGKISANKIKPSPNAQFH